MCTKIVFFAIIALLVLCNVADGKKSKKNKRPKVEEDHTTLQPNVVTYSTFGFNDVASYDGFVPTSPDYASFLSVGGQESATRLYAPAFPSAMESAGFSGNFGSSPFTEQSSGADEDNVGASGMLHYQSSPMNYFNTPNFGTADNQNKNVGSEDVNEHNTDELETPVYGTKINSRYRSTPNQFNITDFGIFSNNYSNLGNDKYFSFQDEPTDEVKPSYSASSDNFQNNNHYVPSYPTVNVDEFEKSLPNHMHSVVNFPKVVDFTKYYPTELDTSKLPDYTKFSNTHNTISNIPIEHSFSFKNNNNKFINSKPATFDFKNNEESSEKNIFKQTNSYVDQDYAYNHITHKPNKPNTKYNSDLKKKTKRKPWISGSHSNDLKNWKDSSSVKEHGYTTNFTNMHFKYDTKNGRTPFNDNHDEVVSASSNVVDLTNYQQQETDFSNFKKMPAFNYEEEYPSFSSLKDKLQPTDYFNQFKSSYSTTPTTTSYWGNTFKNSEYSLFEDNEKKPYFNENNSDDIVINIPKRPNKLNSQKPSEYKHIEWPSANHRPHKNKPFRDWTKDFVDTRYKSEEDLLGLRNHDTSHPTYIPTYKTSSDAGESEKDFKKLVEKWRQSYLKSKYKDILRDHESYGTEIKPLHVPLAKPYPIEVPHPVIVPVPQPYPVRVPVARPVAVPVVRELTVSIEKPVPYPVIKKVPYPVEKLVPVPVEKEIAVPVEKPYPVHVPYIRPVFHHTRPVHENYDTDHEEDDFMRRPEFKKAPQHYKRPYSSRNKPRRPSRTVYQERSRRRWPDRRRPSGQVFEYTRSARPFGYEHSPPYKHHGNEPEEEENDRSVYAYCRRTGNC